MKKSTTAGTSFTPALPVSRIGCLKGRGDDPDRFIFTGRVLPEHLASIFRMSDLHIYLTAPFVLSWSLLDAMASGCVVLASDVPPVREVIEPGQNGLIEPLFDVDRLDRNGAARARRSGGLRSLGRAARDDDRGKVLPRSLHPTAG